jgi:nucleotide-binding universal stress UspA family protein
MSDSATPAVGAVRLERVLFCTDFSENADFALDYAIALLRPGAVLYLLHVIPEPDAQFWKTYVYEVDNVDEKAKHDLDDKVEAYRHRLPTGLDFRPCFRIGRDSSEILRFAEEEVVDLIVMGRHGSSGLEKVFFGNVTERVARKAKCPVLVVPWCFHDAATRSGGGAARAEGGPR